MYGTSKNIAHNCRKSHAQLWESAMRDRLPFGKPVMGIAYSAIRKETRVRRGKYVSMTVRRVVVTPLRETAEFIITRELGKVAKKTLATLIPVDAC